MVGVQGIRIHRGDGRAPSELRAVRLSRGWLQFADGSCLIECGNTRLICAASVLERVPSFLKDTGSGWVTGEYGMLPRACTTRNEREAARGKQEGRTVEIQRLIGRSLRAAVDLNAIGERTIIVDCDVLQGDGGTRTAAVTGGFVALVEALSKLRDQKVIKTIPLYGFVAAVSVGIVDRRELLDLTYEEDSRAAVDMNVVMREGGKLIEVQATAEGEPFTYEQLGRLLEMAQVGINRLIELQKKVLAGVV